MSSHGHPYQLRSINRPLDPAERLDRARLRTFRAMMDPNTMSSATQTQDTMSDITRAMRYLHTSPTGAPSHFDGISDNITDWLDDFDLYLSLLRVTSNDEKLPLLIAFLTGTAKLWFKTLPATTRLSYADLRQAMITRFARTPFQINTQRSFIYQLRQEPGELFPSFVLRVQKAARGLNIQQSDVLAICLQGADSRIQPHLLMAKPTSIDELLAQPIVIEANTIETKLIPGNKTPSMDVPHRDIRFADADQVLDTTPDSSRTIDSRPSRPKQRQFTRQNRTLFRPPSRDRSKFLAKSSCANASMDQSYRRDRRPIRRTEACGRCSLHHNGRLCPAISQRCHFCNKFGHFSNVCRKRLNHNSSK